MAGERIRNNGVATYVISPTIPVEQYKMIRKVASMAGKPMTSVTRVAIELGLKTMNKAMELQAEGNDKPWGQICSRITTDGRADKSRNNDGGEE